MEEYHAVQRRPVPPPIDRVMPPVFAPPRFPAKQAQDQSPFIGTVSIRRVNRSDRILGRIRHQCMQSVFLGAC